MARFPLKDRYCLITGASGGIGEATALELARRGARLVLAARRATELERVSERIRQESNSEVVCVTADVTSAPDRARLREAIEMRCGALHLVVHNAGITAHGRFDESQPEVLRRTMELNFFSVAELTLQLLPLIEQSSGERRLVLVSTPSGLYGVPGRFAYSSSKAAGHALMECLRMELQDKKIGTTIFCPGYTRTALRTSGLAADGSRLSEEQARGAKDPEEVARLLVRAVERRRRLVVMGVNGHVMRLGRTLFPGLLERLMRKKLAKDFAPHA